MVLVKGLPTYTWTNFNIMKVFNTFLTHCEISDQEAIYRLMSLPLIQGSQQVVFVCTNVPEQRTRLFKPMKLIKKLADGDSDVYMVIYKLYHLFWGFFLVKNELKINFWGAYFFYIFFFRLEFWNIMQQDQINFQTWHWMTLLQNIENAIKQENVIQGKGQFASKRDWVQWLKKQILLSFNTINGAEKASRAVLPLTAFFIFPLERWREGSTCRII